MTSTDRLIFGVGPVRELVNARPRAITVLYLARERAEARGKDPVAALADVARAAGVIVELLPLRELDRLAPVGSRHQGAVAVTGAFRYAELESLVGLAVGAPPLVVILDGVQDPHNLGAIIRSAYLFGACGVVIPEHRATEVTGTATKSSAGATELIAIARVPNLVRALERLKELGLWACAVASAPTARPIASIDLRGPLALVVGAEGEGVRPLVARTCDMHAEIPMAGPGIGSLNASVAAGVALYEVARQRTAAAK